MFSEEIREHSRYKSMWWSQLGGSSSFYAASAVIAASSVVPPWVDSSAFYSTPSLYTTSSIKATSSLKLAPSVWSPSSFRNMAIIWEMPLIKPWSSTSLFFVTNFEGGIGLINLLRTSFLWNAVRGLKYICPRHGVYSSINILLKEKFEFFKTWLLF